MKDTVLCVGTLVLDIFAGPINGVIKPNTGFGAGIYPREGGNALNVAVSLSKMNYPKGKITLASVAGADIYAGMFEAYLEKNGIKAKTKIIKGLESNKCLIIGFADNSRAFVGFHGANDFYFPKDVIKVLRRIKPGIFYAGETSSLPKVDAKIAAILKEAKKLDAINVVDYIISSGKPSKQLFSAMPLIDVFHINDYEAKLLTGKSDIRQALKKFIKAGVKLPIITAGEKPMVFAYKGRIYKMPVFKVKYVDGTGAGDAFTAGIIKGLSDMKGKGLYDRVDSGKNLIGLITLAQASGAAAVTKVGCTAGVTVKRIKEILRGAVPCNTRDKKIFQE
jgi:sugar/nucleoside kinase (ribokinase family)